MTLEKEQKKNNLDKIFEVIKTMASKPSGLIGLSILLFHVILAITSPLYVPYAVSYTHLTLPTKRIV